MSVKYLFPCRCGQQSVVEARQAGQSIVCRCGASLQVPTMLEMTTALEVASDDANPASFETAWHWRQRLLLLGCVMLVAAGVATVCVYFGRPIAPSDIFTPERIQRAVAHWTPKETWEAWESIRQGLDTRPDPKYEAAVLRFHVWEAATFALALGGVALLIGAMLMARGRGRHGDTETRR